MIKSLIILVLLLVLVAGAFLSRPSPGSLKAYLQQKNAATSGGGAGGLLQGLLNDAQIDSYLQTLTVKDRLLWVDVQRNGQTVYTGAFAHWWQRSSATPAAAPTVKS